MKQTKLVLLIFLLHFCFSVAGQQKLIWGVVKDVQSDEPVPFASVIFKHSSIGKLTDTSGFFYLYVTALPSDTLEISATGYKTYLFVIDKNLDSVHAAVIMERKSFNIGVEVNAKVNKGLFLWQKMVQHKKSNSRQYLDNYAYESYNKIELDIRNADFEKLRKFKPLRSAEEIIKNNIDTTGEIKILPAYFAETVSENFYQRKPKKKRVEVKAIRTGFSDNESMIKMFGGLDESINVYDDYIPVLDKKFIGPLNDKGDKYYHYRVVDTQFIADNTYYHLIFSPQRKMEGVFEGDCWVQSGTFAVQKMSLRLSEGTNTGFLDNLSLIQEFKMSDDQTWFIYKDKLIVEASPMGKDKPGFIIKKLSHYRNILMNDKSVANEIAKSRTPDQIITAPDAEKKDSLYWLFARNEPLNKKESGAIKMIDTLTQNKSFIKFTNRINFLSTGYINKRNFQIGPWSNWASTNSWEGLRLQFDVNTKRRSYKNFIYHAYIAYGFKDEKAKGMIDAYYMPRKDPNEYVYASYRNDLDWGQNYYGGSLQQNLVTFAARKKGVPIKNIAVQETRLAFVRPISQSLTGKISFSHKSSVPLRNLLPVDSFLTTVGKSLTSFEASFTLRFAYLESFNESSFYRTSLGSPYPIGEITVSRGFPNVLKSSYGYTKIMATISDNTKIPPLGNLSWRVYAGKTFGTLPYTLLNIAPGNELFYYNPLAYNLINRWEYIHDRYAGFNMEHNFGKGIFSFIRKTKMQQFWTAKALWGNISEANKNLNFKSGSNFQSLNGKTYLELGTGVDNILGIFRVDFIWRLLPDTLPNPIDKKFGVFGSMKINF